MINLITSTILTASLIFGLASPEQSKVFTFSGMVVDSTTSEPVPFANIVFYQKDGAVIDGTITDSNGHFAKKLSSEQVEGLEKITIQFTGYLDQVLPFQMDGRTSYNYQIELKGDTVELTPLTIITTYSMTTNGCIVRSIVIDENGDTLRGHHKDWIRSLQGKK